VGRTELGEATFSLGSRGAKSVEMGRKRDVLMTMCRRKRKHEALAAPAPRSWETWWTSFACHSHREPRWFTRIQGQEMQSKASHIVP